MSCGGEATVRGSIHHPLSTTPSHSKGKINDTTRDKLFEQCCPYTGLNDHYQFIPRESSVIGVSELLVTARGITTSRTRTGRVVRVNS
ncbi:hypothetical protein J6590_012466 [Homalodisca vitripennis]|nr:hypothetical protein J6590_012466 [Homalodisca vitripennis]